MTEVGLFLVLFFAGALILTFWIVPGCIAAFTPFKHKEVLQDLKSALLIVVATTLSVSALPYISSATQHLARASGIEDPECGGLFARILQLPIRWANSEISLFLFLYFLRCTLTRQSLSLCDLPFARHHSALLRGFTDFVG